MPAPVATARTVPTTRRLESGQGTKITFSAVPGLSVWEKETTPPGIEGGDPVDNTNHFNTVWRTKAARKLKELTDTSFSGFYNTSLYTDLLTVVNVEQTITVTFPDGGTLAFFGYLKTFAQGAHNEGNTAPTATFTIVATNTDPTTGLEQGPAFTPPVGGAPMLPRGARVRPRVRNRAA